MTNLNRQSLIAKVKQKSGMNTADTMHVLDMFFAEIQNSLVEGNGVKLTNFGTFSTRLTPQRPGRNPKTNEPVTIQAQRRVCFKPARRMRSAVAARKRNA